MIVAITGTPGCGKTSVAECLKGRGRRVLRVEDVARPSGESDGELIFSAKDLDEATLPQHEERIFIEGHLSHFIKNDLTVVLRCSPADLRIRLSGRGYGPAKISDNAEAEMVDVIFQESLGLGRKIVQIDATRRSPSEVADIIERLCEGEEFRSETPDWLGEEARAC